MPFMSSKQTTEAARLQQEMIAMDLAYSAFNDAIRAVLRSMQTAMKGKGVQLIGLGQGVPKRSHGIESKTVLTKMVLQDGKIVLLDRAGESHRLDTLDTDAMHYLASRVRGLNIFAKLIE